MGTLLIQTEQKNTQKLLLTLAKKLEKNAKVHKSELKMEDFLSISTHNKKEKSNVEIINNVLSSIQPNEIYTEIKDVVEFQKKMRDEW